MNAFLGVEHSLTGRRWCGPSIETARQAEAISQQTALPPALAQVLARLGVAVDEAQSYLEPTLKDLMPDPRGLRDMEAAAKRFIDAAQGAEPIAIFADYDVDGGSSAALLIHWLRQFGYPVERALTLYVPDRIDEGYGPNPEAMGKLAAEHRLIICVDCGTLSHEALAAATGADVLVLDHHLGGETLPPALAVVNPNRQDEDGTLAHLCAAAVVFLMLVEARRQLRERGQNSPDLIGLLDLVALATVADVAPLKGVNRAFVRQGLKVLGQWQKPGLAALATSAKLTGPPSAYSLGFVLGPRINAGGRIGRADMGARLLSSIDSDEARSFADMLETHNQDRRDIENAVRDAAFEQAETRGLEAPLIWAAGKGWHPGVVGIVAARLKEATNRPAIVIGIDDGIGKGSGRSVSGIDLGSSVQRLAAEGLLEKGGGHKMAAGLTLSETQIEPAMARLSELLERQGAGRAGPADLNLDGLLMPGAVSVELIQQIEHAGPFGAGAPGPRFAFADQKIMFAKRVGENHLKIRFGDGLGAQIDAIAFSAYDSALGPALEGHAGARFHLAGQLDINRWQGRESVQLRLTDAAPAAH